MMTYEEKLKKIEEVFIKTGFKSEMFNHIVQSFLKYKKQPFKNVSVDAVQKRLTDLMAFFKSYQFSIEDVEVCFNRYPYLFFNNPMRIQNNVFHLSKEFNIPEQKIVQKFKNMPSIFCFHYKTILANIQNSSKLLRGFLPK